MHIVNGPGNGFSKNFFSLLCNSSSKSSYYAFADQDDIWDPNKLTKGIEFLSKFSNVEWNMKQQALKLYK